MIVNLKLVPVDHVMDIETNEHYILTFLLNEDGEDGTSPITKLIKGIDMQKQIIGFEDWESYDPADGELSIGFDHKDGFFIYGRLTYTNGEFIENVVYGTNFLEIQEICTHE